MSGYPGETGESLRGDAEPITGVAGSPVSGQVAAPVQDQPGAAQEQPAPAQEQPALAQEQPGAAPPAAQEQPAPAQDQPGKDRHRKGRWRRVTGMIALLVIGLGATGAGGTLLFLELTRHATKAEASAAGQQQLASLWQRMTIGQIFPRTVSYAGAGGNQTDATRIGVAPQSSCAAATDPAIAQALRGSGCVTMLRATYADQSGTLLATVGIAVMDSTGRAQQAQNAILGTEHKAGILAVSFPGSAFPGSAREVFGAGTGQGPYVFFYTAGYADGRSTSFGLNDDETGTIDLGSGVMDDLSALFAAPAKPCASKDITC